MHCAILSPLSQESSVLSKWKFPGMKSIQPLKFMQFVLRVHTSVALHLLSEFFYLQHEKSLFLLLQFHISLGAHQTFCSSLLLFLSTLISCRRRKRAKRTRSTKSQLSSNQLSFLPRRAWCWCRDWTTPRFSGYACIHATNVLYANTINTIKERLIRLN